MLDGRLSARALSLDIAARIGPEDRIICYGTYLHAIPFYTGRTVDLANWIGELYYAKRDPALKDRFGDDETIRALPDPARRTFVVLRRKELPHFITLNPPEQIRGLRPFGEWVLAEL